MVRARPAFGIALIVALCLTATWALAALQNEDDADRPAGRVASEQEENGPAENADLRIRPVARNGQAREDGDSGQQPDLQAQDQAGAEQPAENAIAPGEGHEQNRDATDLEPDVESQKRDIRPKQKMLRPRLRAVAPRIKRPMNAWQGVQEAESGQVRDKAEDGDDGNKDGRESKRGSDQEDPESNLEQVAKQPAPRKAIGRLPMAARLQEKSQMKDHRLTKDIDGEHADSGTENEAGNDYVFESPKEVVERIRAISKRSIASDNSKDNIVSTLLLHVEELERYLLSSNSDPDQPRDAHVANSVNLKECRVTMAKFREQSRAFDELLKEKTSLKTMLKDEHSRLEEYQRNAKSPELGAWLLERSSRLKAYFETPETDAVAYYAKRFMESELSAAQDGISFIESKLEDTVDAVLPARYGGFVTLVLTSLIVAFPIAVTTRYVHTLSKSVSLRQYIFLGNLFLASFAIGVGMVGLLLWQDPLKTLYDSAENLFIFLQLGLALVYAVILCLLALVLRGIRHDRTTYVFASELIFYLAVGYHYHGRIWGPTMLGRPLETSPALYVMYIVDFCAMVALTISTVEPLGDVFDVGLPRHEGRAPSPQIVSASSKGD